MRVGAFAAALAFGVGGAAAEGGYIGAGGANLLAGDGPIAAASTFDLDRRRHLGAYGSVGYVWRDGFSTEVEGGLRAREFSGVGQVDNGRGAAEETTSLMLNARIAPPVRGPLKPYAGVGAGLAFVNLADHSDRSERGDMAAAGQALAGFSLEVSQRTSLFAEYRYFKLLENSPVTESASARDQSHSGLVGLRVKLGDFDRR